MGWVLRVREARECGLFTIGLVVVNWRWGAGAGNIRHSVRLSSGNERNRGGVDKRWVV